MRIGIIYTSISGNTKELAHFLYEQLNKRNNRVNLFQIDNFPVHELAEYDGIVIGTYTWGDGEIPIEMKPLYQAFEKEKYYTIVTGIFGSGDSFYPNFCGAVNKFRDLLRNKSELAVTLKVELLPQKKDFERCEKFIDLFSERLFHLKSIH